MWKNFTEAAREAIYNAEQAAKEERTKSVEAHHLLSGVLTINDDDVNRVLLQFASNEQAIREQVRKAVGPPLAAKITGEISLSPQGKQVIDKMYDEARLLKSTKMIKPIFIFLVLIQGDHLAGRVLRELGFDVFEARDYLQLKQ